MEFGGYVDPPSHLGVTSKRQAPEGRPADLRTIPDYDYSLFRYSKLALPFLLLIIASGAVLMGLSFWQGPYGYVRGPNGLQDGVPRDFHLANNDAFSNKDREGGLKKSLRSLRCANFVIGMVPLIFAIFAIRSEPSPVVLRVVLLICAFCFFSLTCTSWVSFALGISQINQLEDCPDLTFISTATSSNVQVHYSPVDFNLGNPSLICRKREQLTSATCAADAAQAFSAMILAVLLVYTTTNANWAWGPGKIPVEKSVNQPRVQFPPPSPFTHIAETRRAYVWLAIFATLAFVIIAFILTIIMHELRTKPKMIDFRNQQVERHGWPTRNNRLRVALSGFVIGVGALSVLDMAGWKRRLVSYLLGTAFFWLFIGLLAVFGLDVHDVNQAKKDLSCPRVWVAAATPAVQIKCYYFAYYATCFVDYWTSMIILFYILYEYIYRVNATWDTFYFYSDSEWLRNHSLFVDQTDREAFDWKKYAMDNGREYYYSPSLGISTRLRPRNFVESEFDQPVAAEGFAPAPVFR